MLHKQQITRIINIIFFTPFTIWYIYTNNNEKIYNLIMLTIGLGFIFSNTLYYYLNYTNQKIKIEDIKIFYLFVYIFLLLYILS